MKTTTQTTDKLPPNHYESESMLICCALDAEDPSEIMPLLTDDLFYDERCRQVLQGMRILQMLGLPICRFELMRLSKDGVINRCISEIDLVSSSNFHNVVPSTMWKYFYTTCREYAAKREAIRIGVEIQNEATPERLRDAAKRLSELACQQGTGELPTMKDRILELVNDMQDAWMNPERRYGLRTGFKKLDGFWMGLHPGRFYLIAARPAMGKTSLAAQIALNVALTQNPVLMFSLEMPVMDVDRRIVQIYSELPMRRFDCKQAVQADHDKLVASVGRLNSLPILIDDQSSDLDRLIGTAQQYHKSHNINLVVIDYIQRISIRGYREKRTEMITTVSNAIKDLAMSLKIPIVALGQLNREMERDSRKPHLSDLRDSGALEQDADSVMFLYSQNPMLPVSEVELIIPKNRYGPTGLIDTIFTKDITKFKEKETEQPASYMDKTP